MGEGLKRAFAATKATRTRKPDALADVTNELAQANAEIFRLRASLEEAERVIEAARDYLHTGQRAYVLDHALTIYDSRRTPDKQKEPA